MNLKTLILRHCISYGDFTLTSGEKSNIFFNLKLALLDPSGIRDVVYSIEKKIQDLHVSAIGGPVLGACPIVSSLLTGSFCSQYNIPGFYIRKEPKEHGTKSLIEGYNPLPHDYVVLVDDVATKGGSLVKAVQVVKQIGCKVVKAIVVLDRQQGAKERLADLGVDLDSIYTVQELGL